MWSLEDCSVFFRIHARRHRFVLIRLGRSGFDGSRAGFWTVLGDVVLCHHSPRWISLRFGQHPLYSVGDPYICATAHYGPCHHFHPRHSLHPPFASSQHLLKPEPSHPSHVIGSVVTGTAIMSV